MIKTELPTVIVIESQEQNRNRLSRSLMSMQFEVREFDSAEAFLRESHRWERGCVVADLRLGGMSGLELQARLKEKASLLPVILVAERVSTQLIVRAMREGAVAFPKSALEAARSVREGRGVVALYLNPLTPDDVFAVTAAGEVLPQKSTFFFPKLPSGLVFRSFEDS